MEAFLKGAKGVKNPNAHLRRLMREAEVFLRDLDEEP
jgi:hypothetical protein